MGTFLMRLILIWLALFAYLQSDALAQSQKSAKRPPIQSQEQAKGGGKSDNAPTKLNYFSFGTYQDLYGEYCSAKTKSEKEKWGKKLVCESNISDALVAIATLLGVFISFLLLCLVAIQIRTTRRQLRAYVFLEAYKGKVPLIDRVAHIIRIPLLVINRGQTPAYKSTNWYYVAILPWPLHNDTRFPRGRPKRAKKTVSPYDLGPKDGQHEMRAEYDFPITAEEEADLRVDKMRIYVFGDICYWDVFGKKRRTEFRWMLKIGPDGNPLELHVCEGGNRST